MQHQEHFFNGHDGIQLYEQVWTPDNTEAIGGHVAIVHGYAEHSGRYADTAAFFASRGYMVSALDHRAHGKSAGQDTYIDDFDDFIEDMDIFIQRVKQRSGNKPVYILGHSMGGLISTDYVIQKQPSVNGVILSGAMLKMGDDISPMLVGVTTFLGKVLPKMKTIKLDGTAVSRDPEVVAKYDSDPLNYRGGVPARTASQMNRAVNYVNAHFEAFTLPVLVLYGTKDRLVNSAGSEAFFQRAKSDNKMLKPYEGLYHEIMNEPEKEMVWSDILNWIERN
ncbi:MAG: lysophospholipase [Anaerolineaceae bacterium]|nr:lysophospholipase [Anaerolineaceae bacterium]